MRILVHESTDKTQRKILEIPKEHLLHLLKIDNGYFEVIPMEDPSAHLRVYFDIETYENIDVLGEALDVLNGIFKTTNENWAISNGSRIVEKDYKISYHILSKKYKMSLNDLRLLVKRLDKSYIDYTAYWFIIDYKCDEGAFRLPNQSKMGINKIGTPMTIVQGEIADFFVTDLCNLEVFSLNN